MTVRLDRRTESAIARLARRKKQTKSEIVREAIAIYERSEAAAPRQTPAAAMAPFIGVADSGGSRRSESTGEGFRSLLTEKARARRSR